MIVDVGIVINFICIIIIMIANPSGDFYVKLQAVILTPYLVMSFTQ